MTVDVPVNSIWKYKHSECEFYIVVKVEFGMLNTSLGYLVDAVYMKKLATGKFDDSSWEYHSAFKKDYERLDND